MTLNVLGTLLFLMSVTGKVSARTVWATDLESYPVQVDQTTGDILINVSSAGSADSAKESGAT